MSYPIGMQLPYSYNNFNDMYGMLGLWAGNNQSNKDLLSNYLQYMPQQTSVIQTPSVQTPSQTATTQETATTTPLESVPAEVSANSEAVMTTDAKPPEMDPDDGKISWSRKFKNIGKGMLNMAKGLFCDEKGFSLKRTLTTVAVAGAAAALTVATGGAAAPFLVAAGVGLGTAQVVRGGYNAMNAKTDAEAEAAWQDIGAGALSVGLSVAGAKGALKAVGKSTPSGNVITGSMKATVENLKIVKDGAKTLVTSPKETLAPLAKVETWTNAGTRVKTAWNENLSLKNSQDNMKKVLEKTYEKDISKLNKRADKLAKEIADLQSKQQTDAIKLEIKQKTSRLKKLYKDIDDIKTTKANIGNHTNENGLQISNNRGHVNVQRASVEARKTAIEKIENKIRSIKDEMKNASASRKAVYEKQLKELKRKLDETNKLNKINEQLDIIKFAQAKNIKLKAALKKINEKIADVENRTLDDAQKAIELAKLNKYKSNIEHLITVNKTKAGVAKVGLYKTNVINGYKNISASEKTVVAGIAGGLHTNSVAENSALSDYQSDVEQYNQELLEAQQADQTQSTQQPVQQQNSEQVQQPMLLEKPEFKFPTGNIYQDYYNNMLAVNNMNVPLGFNDLYVSPYPEML